MICVHVYVIFNFLKSLTTQQVFFFFWVKKETEIETIWLGKISHLAAGVELEFSFAGSISESIAFHQDTPIR